MRTTIAARTTLVAVAIVAASIGSAAAGQYTGDVNFFLGGKLLNSDWESASVGVDLSDQPQWGVTVSWGEASWPVRIATDILFSTQDDEIPLFAIKFEASTLEVGLGVRKVWEGSKIRPFVGAGIAYVAADLDVTFAFPVKLDDRSVGAWIDGGVFWRLTKRFNLGFEVRISRAQVDFEGEDTDAGGEHVGLLLGFGW